MQFIDLQTQYQRLQEEIQTGINAVLSHGQYILGPEVQQLEEQLAHYVGVKHCITVANGTDALMIALMALGIEANDEVITSPFSFIANAEMIALLGAKPVFVDIDPNTYNIDANKIEQAITKKTKCIMPVSLYGQCADMNKINEIANKYNLTVIEDGAQSFGATYHGKKSCNLSTIGCTSFFPSKPLGCYGDGGACFTNDDLLAKTMRQIRVHGQEKRYYHRILGVNSRLDTLQAAVLLAKLKIFDDEVKARQNAATRYQQMLKPYVKIMTTPPQQTCVYAQYTIASHLRGQLINDLQKAGVPTAIHYPLAIHQQPVFKTTELNAFPFAEQAANSVFSLPMHPYLDASAQQLIANQIIQSLEKQANVINS